MLKSAQIQKSIVLALAIFAGLHLFGQEKDAGLWTSLGIETGIAKRFNLSLVQEFRFHENISELGTSFTDVGLDYKLNKHFQVAANFRFIQKRKTNNSFSYRYRPYLDIKYTSKIKPIEFAIRCRIQDEIADVGRAADGGVPEYYLRNKFSLSLDRKKLLSPYISAEFFSPLNFPRSTIIDNIRTSVGLKYALSKHNEFEMYYMIQKEVQVSNPRTDFIIGLGYYHKI